MNIIEKATAPLPWHEQPTFPGPWHSHAEPVARQTVYWRAGPMLYETLEEAIAFCEQNDFLPELMIAPVPAVESADGRHYRLLE